MKMIVLLLMADLHIELYNNPHVSNQTQIYHHHLQGSSSLRSSKCNITPIISLPLSSQTHWKEGETNHVEPDQETRWMS